MISYRRAVILVSICVILGALIDGEHVIKTIGKGIIDQPLDHLAIFVALVCSGIFVTVANATEKCCDVFLNQRPDIPKSLQKDFWLPL